MSFHDEVKEILIEILDINESELDMDLPIRSGLGATSVDLVEIVAELENRYNLDISEEEAKSMRTGNDIVKFLESKNL